MLRHEIPVRYGEVDMQGVVFNAHYLAYVDDAMTHWMTDLGYPFTDLGWDFMVRHAELDWTGSATYGEVVVITGTVDHWGTTSFRVRFTLRTGDEPFCVVHLTYVGVDPVTHDKSPIPERFRTYFTERSG